MKQESISILGCGWLGLPLAEFLIAKNFRVTGSTTKKEKLNLLNKKSIEGFLINIPEDLNTKNFDQFLNSETLLINIPPGRIDHNNNSSSHSEIISSMSNKIKTSPIKNVIYISSTSVYKDINQLVTEEGPFVTEGTGSELLKAESILLQNKTINISILRLGGLYGYGRVPIKKNDTVVTLDNHRKLNLLHRDNACEVIYLIIKNNFWNKIYNVCEDEHPTQKEFFDHSSLSSQIENFKIIEKNNDYKIVSNFKLRIELGINLLNKISHS